MLIRFIVLSLPYQDYIYNMAGNVKSEEWESPEETEIIEVTPCTSKQPVNMVNVIIFTEYTTGTKYWYAKYGIQFLTTNDVCFCENVKYVVCTRDSYNVKLEENKITPTQ